MDSVEKGGTITHIISLFVLFDEEDNQLNQANKNNLIIKHNKVKSTEIKAHIIFLRGNPMRQKPRDRK